MGVTVRAENVKRALRAAREIAEGRKLLGEVRGDFNRFVLALQGTAQRAAPVEEGTLRGSGRSEISFQGNDLHGTITFGGLASAYAEVQHERDDFEHPKGGGAHYLYGPGSPWETGQAAAVGMLDRRVGEIAERYIGGAGNG